MMAERHTLGEAARLLRVSRHTLDKWLERLGIEPTRHEYDYRFFTISAEQLQAIRDARAKMPVADISDNIPSYSTLAFDRRESGEVVARDASPGVAATPRQRPLQRHALRTSGEGIVPPGMMSRTEVATLHNFPASTLRRWCDSGVIETDSGVYGGEHGQFQAARPVTARGLRQFYALAHQRPDFTPCPQCPHSELPDTGGTGETGEAS